MALAESVTSDELNKEIDIQPLTNIEIQLTGTDGNSFICKLSADDVARIQSDESYGSDFLEKIKNIKNIKNETSSIYIDNGAGGQDNVPKAWRRGETNFLVHLRLTKDQEFQQKKVHTELWQEICAAMCDNGYDVTSYKCANKWKSLKRTYIAIIDSNEDTNSAKLFPYFEEFHELYSATPRVKLAKIYTESTSRKSRKRENPDTCYQVDDFDSEIEFDVDTESTESDGLCKCVHTCKNQKNEPLEDDSNFTPMIEFLKEFVDLQRQSIFQQQQYLQKTDEFYLRFNTTLTNLAPKRQRPSN